MGGSTKRTAAVVTGATVGAVGGGFVGGPVGALAGGVGGAKLGAKLTAGQPASGDDRMQRGLELKQQLLTADIPAEAKNRLIGQLMPEGTGTQSLIDLNQLDAVSAELSKLTGISDEANMRAKELSTLLTRQPGKSQTLLTGVRR